MISVNLAYNGYVGLSTDSKPTEDVNNGSRFYEMDTAKSYMFDAEGLSWIEQPAEGGSGGAGGGLVVTWDSADTDALDKSWQEIHDALEEGQAVTIVNDGSDYDDIGVVIGCAAAGASAYQVAASTWTGSTFGTSIFQASSADGELARLGG